MCFLCTRCTEGNTGNIHFGSAEAAALHMPEIIEKHFWLRVSYQAVYYDANRIGKRN